MKYFHIILTLIICAFIALAVLYNLYGRVSDVLNETPSESIVIPVSVKTAPEIEPTPENYVCNDGYDAEKFACK